jgi:hypothetical protein
LLPATITRLVSALGAQWFLTDHCPLITDRWPQQREWIDSARSKALG